MECTPPRDCCRPGAGRVPVPVYEGDQSGVFWYLAGLAGVSIGVWTDMMTKAPLIAAHRGEAHAGRWASLRIGDTQAHDLLLASGPPPRFGLRPPTVPT